MAQFAPQKGCGCLKPGGGGERFVVVGLPIDWTQDPVENGVPPSTTSNDSQDNQEQLAATPKDTLAPEAVATAAKVASPSAPPLSDEDIPAFLDRRPLSAEDQRVFDVIMAAWKSASAVVRERVRAELIQANTHSPADHNPPTVSVMSAQTADAAALAEVAKPESPDAAVLDPKAKAADAADAGIKYRDIEVPGYATVPTTNLVVVRRKRRRPKKVSGPLDSTPF